MNTLFLIIIIALLGYVIYDQKKDSKETKKPTLLYQKIVPEYLKKSCELTLKKPLLFIDVMFSVKGILVDIDDEWVMMEVATKKNKVFKILRIDNIIGIKELR